MKKMNLWLMVCLVLVMSNAFSASFERIQDPQGSELSPVSLAWTELTPSFSVSPLNKIIEGTFKINSMSNKENSLAIAKQALKASLKQDFRDKNLSAILKNATSVSLAINSALRNVRIEESGKSLVDRLTSLIASTDNTDIYSAIISDNFSAGSALIIIDRLEHEVFVIGSYYNE